MNKKNFKQGQKYIFRFLDGTYLYGKMYVFNNIILIIRKGKYPWEFPLDVLNRFEKMDFNTWLNIEHPLPF